MKPTRSVKPRKRRRNERDARINWILDEALDVAIAEGIAGLTTSRLAQRLGYTPAAFYRYFSSKDELLVALETRTAERFYALFFERLERERELPRARHKSPIRAALAEIVLLARNYAELAQAHPAHFRLIGVLVTGERSWIHGESAVRLRALVLPRLVEIIGYFQRAEEAGALSRGSAPLRAMVMWTSLHAVLATAPLRGEHPGLFDLEPVRRELLRTLLIGWGAPPRDVDHVLDARGAR